MHRQQQQQQQQYIVCFSIVVLLRMRAVSTCYVSAVTSLERDSKYGISRLSLFREFCTRVYERVKYKHGQKLLNGFSEGGNFLAFDNNRYCCRRCYHNAISYFVAYNCTKRYDCAQRITIGIDLRHRTTMIQYDLFTSLFIRRVAILECVYQWTTDICITGEFYAFKCLYSERKQERHS